MTYRAAQGASTCGQTANGAPERDTCQRYLAWSKLDRNAGVTDYQRISVTMGWPDCGMKIPAEPTA